MIRERKQTLKISFVALDAALSFFAFLVAVVLHFYVISPERRALFAAGTDAWLAPDRIFPGNQHLQILIAYAQIGAVLTLMQVMVFLAVDLYRPRTTLQPLREVLHIVRAVGIALVLVLALLFFYRAHSYSRAVVGYAAILTVLFLSGGHALLRRYLAFRHGKGQNVRNVLVVGTGTNAARFVGRLEKYSMYGFRIVGVIGPAARADRSLRGLILGPIARMESICESEQIDSIVVALDAGSQAVLPIVEFCYREGIDCRIVPDMLDLVTHGARVEEMDGIPVLTLRDIPLNNGYHRFMKRSFDVVFALTVLVLTGPVLLLLALLVKLSSPGPVLFAQERVGLDRRTFRLLKFRSMVVQEKTRSDTTWGSKQDARVTRIGAFLRKTSLDELPQFINVLRGDMSVVGPRPERPHFVKQFKEKYEHYMLRHRVKAGITGWAQILGYRGDTSIEKRVEADIYYIENWSLLFDVLILLRTIPSMIRSPGE